MPNLGTSSPIAPMSQIPLRYDFRLEDLRAWHLVEASCRRCRHRTTIAHPLLTRGRPSYTRLSDLERELRCQRCGARGEASLSVHPRPRD